MTLVSHEAPLVSLHSSPGAALENSVSTGAVEWMAGVPVQLL